MITSNISLRQNHMGQKGMGKLTALLTILFFLFVGYVGFRVAPWYYNYHELKGLMSGQADKARVFKDSQIRDVLMQKIRSLKIPIKNEREIKIKRFTTQIEISCAWKRKLYLDLSTIHPQLFWQIHEFHFKPRVKRRIQ